MSCWWILLTTSVCLRKVPSLSPRVCWIQALNAIYLCQEARYDTTVLSLVFCENRLLLGINKGCLFLLTEFTLWLPRKLCYALTYITLSLTNGVVPAAYGGPPESNLKSGHSLRCQNSNTRFRIWRKGHPPSSRFTGAPDVSLGVHSKQKWNSL
jgi:hypothetical protein